MRSLGRDCRVHGQLLMVLFVGCFLEVALWETLGRCGVSKTENLIGLFESTRYETMILGIKTQRSRRMWRLFQILLPSICLSQSHFSRCSRCSCVVFCCFLFVSHSKFGCPVSSPFYIRPPLSLPRSSKQSTLSAITASNTTPLYIPKQFSTTENISKRRKFSDSNYPLRTTRVQLLHSVVIDSYTV